jgi:hypothetical protein
MKKFILLLICLCLALMPSIPAVFAGDPSDGQKSDQMWVQGDQESVMVARYYGGYHGGYRGGYYRHGYYHHRPFGCWAPLPPP